jgi:hypothetical protein
VHATAHRRRGRHSDVVATLRVAVVSRDPDVRLSAARAFDPAPASWSVRLHEDPPDDADVVIVGPDVDARGDVKFDPADPDAVLRAVASIAGDGGRLIVVTSPGGGTGTTTLALHIAASMSGDATTCFVDLDRRWGVATRLGIREDARRWGSEEPEVSTMLSALPVAPGFRVLLAPDGSDPGCRKLLASAVAAFDAVIADVPNGPDLAPALEVANAAVLVVTPTAPGAHRASRLLADFPNVPWAPATNRLGPGGETTRTEIERVLGRKVALELPCSPGLRDAEDDCRLLTSTWSRYGRAVARLCAALERA